MKIKLYDDMNYCLKFYRGEDVYTISLNSLDKNDYNLSSVTSLVEILFDAFDDVDEIELKTYDDDTEEGVMEDLIMKFINEY